MNIDKYIFTTIEIMNRKQAFNGIESYSSIEHSIDSFITGFHIKSYMQSNKIRRVMEKHDNKRSRRLFTNCIAYNNGKKRLDVNMEEERDSKEI